MTTLLTAIFYLWFVTTILLVVLWLVRRQDRKRSVDEGSEHDGLFVVEDEVEDEAGADGGPRDAGPTVAIRPAAVTRIELPTVLDLLDGITLPFDLAPSTVGIVEPERHAIFLSSHHDAEATGTAFADELTRLGFDIEPAGFDQALAVRGDDVLTLRICPDATTVLDGTAPRFVAAEESDTAIEVWVGRGSPPPVRP